MGSEASLEMTRLAFSVVVPAYNAAGVVQTALATLVRQDFEEPFEVVVVDSGPRSCREEALGWLPAARVIRVPERLFPAAARNAGIRASGGEHIAFLPADCEAAPAWLSERLRVHRQGFEAVGGSIANGFPGHPVAMAEYLLEYSALMPNAELLRQQGIPHALSFHRSVFDRFGLYPEDVRTGEDTLFNARCIRGGISIGFAPRAYLAHHGSRSLRSLVAHAMEHGRGLEQCVAAYDFPSAVGPLQQPTRTAITRMLLRYPAMGLRNKFKRLARYQPRLLPTLALLSPIITIGMIATGFGAFREWLVRRRTL